MNRMKKIAKEALRGKWFIAVIVGLIASLLGGIGSEGPKLKLDIHTSSPSLSLEYAGRTIFSTGGGVMPEARALLFSGVTYLLLAAIILTVLYFILGSVVSVGYARFNLKLVDRYEPSFEDLFAYFSIWKTTTVMRILRGIYIALWSLLLVIPGIMAVYSYAMTEYILAEHPYMTASEAMRRSKEMMSGYRMHLFLLQLSFIGWHILCAFTMGIGNLWLIPYQQAATAVFYREISGAVS